MTKDSCGAVLMWIDQTLEGESALPHNALEDARGNMRAWLGARGMCLDDEVREGHDCKA